jgi:hypothetical protein
MKSFSIRSTVLLSLNQVGDPENLDLVTRKDTSATLKRYGNLIYFVNREIARIEIFNIWQTQCPENPLK